MSPDLADTPPGAPRLNARLDPETQRRLYDLTQSSGDSVSHVVREAIAAYHVMLQARRARPQRLLAMVGRWDSRQRGAAVDHKALAADAIEAKWAPSHPLPPSAATPRARKPAPRRKAAR